MGAHKCQFGTIHEMCRCPIPHEIDCPTPETCKPRSQCSSALMLKGELFKCDRSVDDQGKHDWDHANKAAEAVWK